MLKYKQKYRNFGNLNTQKGDKIAFSFHQPMRITTKQPKPIVFFSLSFIFPFLIMLLLLAFRGIWWGSDTTILASDGFHQYVIFNQLLRNSLHGEGSLFYTFTSGLGLNFYALIAYYLGSFLSPFTYFFDLESMPNALYLFTLIKFGLIGLSLYTSLSGIYKRLSPWMALLLSTSLSLMSFSTSQLEINSWLDVFILLPLVLLGLHKLTTGRGKILYFSSLLCLFIQNYYFGYMVAIFISLWFLVQLSWDFKGRIRYFIDFTVVSILATLSSMIILLPIYLDLKTHGETLTKITDLQTENSWYLDLFAKNLVGNFDTTKFGAIPMIYVGLFPLILALLFFTLSSIKWYVKLAYASLLGFIIASFYLQPLDLFWQGMHAPNMFLHRYAWVFSYIIVYMAAETLSRIEELKQLKQIIFPFLFLSAGFLLTYLFRQQYTFLDTFQFIFSLEFLIAYALLLFFFVRKKLGYKFLNLACLGFVLLEISIHTNFQIEGIANEWHFPSLSGYQENLTAIDNLVKYTDEENDQFYRMEVLKPKTGNDGMKYNYNGISQFSSIRNRSSSAMLDKLGFRSDGTNLNLRYQNNTLIAESLFGIKYNLSSTNPAKFGFDFVQSDQNVNLYKNQFALPLAILTNGVYKDVTFTNQTLDNQTLFLNQLTGLRLQYYSTLTPLSSSNTSELGDRIIAKPIDSSTDAVVNYRLAIPANSQVYVNLPKLTFTNSASEKIRISFDHQSQEFTVDNSFSFFTVGSFPEAREVEITISFPENSQVSFDPPEFYRLDTVNYQTAMEALSSKRVHAAASGNKITLDYTSSSDASLLLTLPYDKGWSAKLDGKPVPISRAQDGLMKIDVEKGDGTIVLTFIPQGFYLGLICFISGIFLFTSYHILCIKRRKKG